MEPSGTAPARSSHARPRWRASRSPLLIATFALLGAALLATTGWGATSATVTPTTQVDPTISITEPTALDAGTTGTSWVSGSPSTIVLGSLRGQQQASATATWKVTTNNPTGYLAQLQNTGSGAVLHGPGSESFPDMGTTPAAIAAATSAFGVAVGSPTSHAQVAPGNLAGTPWGTTGGTQGTLFAGVPSTGVSVGSAAAAITDDPITLTMAANLSSTQPLPAVAYSGTLRMTATTL